MHSELHVSEPSTTGQPLRCWLAVSNHPCDPLVTRLSGWVVRSAGGYSRPRRLRPPGERPGGPGRRWRCRSGRRSRAYSRATRSMARRRAVPQVSPDQPRHAELVAEQPVLALLLLPHDLFRVEPPPIAQVAPLVLQASVELDQVPAHPQVAACPSDVVADLELRLDRTQAQLLQRAVGVSDSPADSARRRTLDGRSGRGDARPPPHGLDRRPQVLERTPRQRRCRSRRRRLEPVLASDVDRVRAASSTTTPSTPAGAAAAHAPDAA